MKIEDRIRRLEKIVLSYEKILRERSILPRTRWHDQPQEFESDWDLDQIEDEINYEKRGSYEY